MGSYKRKVAMKTICTYLKDDHMRCDALFEQAQASVAQGDWAQAEASFAGFCQALERHMAMEDTVLFPAFEAAIGSANGPTAGMRTEHRHIRGLVERLAESIRQRHVQYFFDHVDTFQMLMQQHNLKEEDMLYPLAERMLASRANEIIGVMNALPAGTAKARFNHHS